MPIFASRTCTADFAVAPFFMVLQLSRRVGRHLDALDGNAAWNRNINLLFAFLACWFRLCLSEQEVKALQHPHHRDLTGRDGDGTAEQRHRAGRRERVRKHHEEFGIPADSFARAVAFTISQPEEMDVSEIVFRGTREAF